MREYLKTFRNKGLYTNLVKGWDTELELQRTEGSDEACLHNILEYSSVQGQLPH